MVTPGTKIVVQDLKRDEGGTVTLRFQMINETDKKFGDRCGFREDGGEGCGPISGVHLLDAATRRSTWSCATPLADPLAATQLVPMSADGGQSEEPNER
jgi:hypothetical protein